MNGDNFSPLDYRYWQEPLAHSLTDDGFTQSKLQVEIALVRALYERSICSFAAMNEIIEACSKVTPEEVRTEEDRIGHDIRALVNCIQQRVSDEAKPFVHATATSFDIVDTANAWRYNTATREVILPALQKLEETLIELTLREADTVQIGRTHGQHAVPITFGFALAEYVSRLGGCIVRIRKLSDELVGKFSGAVGAHNATALFVEDVEAFEVQVLQYMELRPGEISTQIVQPEPLLRLLNEFELIAGVISNLACDMRHLQRTEIAEVGEAFGKDQVGSSTMPQKRNPINFENVQSIHRIIAGLLATARMSQISEHQRDLLGSASGRTVPEVFCYLLEMVTRMNRTMAKLVVDKESIERNLCLSEGGILAEPLYLIFARLGHPDAHEVVRKLTIAAREQGRPLQEVAANDPSLAEYFRRMTEQQRQVLANPRLYTGIAGQKARKVAEHWRTTLSTTPTETEGE